MNPNFSFACKSLSIISNLHNIVVSQMKKEAHGVHPTKEEASSHPSKPPRLNLP